MSVTTHGTRGPAFLITLEGDEELGMARVFDASMGRIHPPLPLAQLKRLAWQRPHRLVTEDEIPKGQLTDALEDVVVDLTRS